jgi:hypothetical protein
MSFATASQSEQARKIPGTYTGDFLLTLDHIPQVSRYHELLEELLKGEDDIQ